MSKHISICRIAVLVVFMFLSGLPLWADPCIDCMKPNCNGSCPAGQCCQGVPLTNLCDCYACKQSGKGTTDPFGPPAPTFNFSLSNFDPGFTYTGTFHLGSDSAPLILQDFNTTIQFAATSDPNILSAAFSSYLWQFEPFSITSHGITITDIDHLALQSGAIQPLGWLNLQTGNMLISAYASWLTTANMVVFDTPVNYYIQIRETSDPNIVNVEFSTYDCPEPASYLLFGSGLLLLICRAIRRR
jgi:hypothetical protein